MPILLKLLVSYQCLIKSKWDIEKNVNIWAFAYENVKVMFCTSAIANLLCWSWCGCGDGAESPSEGADFISGPPGVVCSAYTAWSALRVTWHPCGSHFCVPSPKPHGTNHTLPWEHRGAMNVARVCELMRAALKGLNYIFIIRFLKYMPHCALQLQRCWALSSFLVCLAWFFENEWKMRLYQSLWRQNSWATTRGSPSKVAFAFMLLKCIQSSKAHVVHTKREQNCSYCNYCFVHSLSSVLIVIVFYHLSCW